MGCVCWGGWRERSAEKPSENGVCFRLDSRLMKSHLLWRYFVPQTLSSPAKRMGVEGKKRRPCSFNMSHRHRLCSTKVDFVRTRTCIQTDIGTSSMNQKASKREKKYMKGDRKNGYERSRCFYFQEIPI